MCNVLVMSVVFVLLGYGLPWILLCIYCVNSKLKSCYPMFMGNCRNFGVGVMTRLKTSMQLGKSRASTCKGRKRVSLKFKVSSLNVKVLNM